MLYLVDLRRSEPGARPDCGALQQVLANRSESAWLGLMQPGSLEILPINFRLSAAPTPEVIRPDEPTAPLFFQSLVHGSFHDEAPSVDTVYERIFELLTRTSEELIGTHGLAPLDVLSLAGRALFFRFLIDRRIVLPTEVREICPAADELLDAFAAPEQAAQTCAWLDETFNGDFLPLIDETIPVGDRESRRLAYLVNFQTVGVKSGGSIYRHLQAILRGWAPRSGDAYQLDWCDLDFAHIPIGVLSQVYEAFSHLADSLTAKETSVHYTPRTIARLLVEEVFSSCPDPAAAKVLDPACGAGIFLALAFRRLVKERWLRDGQRPTAAGIQQILYGQLRGFEISESALRLAALTLYISAIEVNDSPRPPRSLKFPRPLRDEVLFHFGPPQQGPAGRSRSRRPAFCLGALAPEVVERFGGQFDLVIGNPPWTRLRERKKQESDSEVEQGTERSGKKERRETDEFNRVFTAIGKDALERRDLGELARTYLNPDKDPDLPFLWRATRWAKEGGLIAMALPARIFPRTSGPGASAWRAVLQAISVTGLISGADLRWTPVWKDIKVPFCLLFARNTPPAPNHRFYFAAPRWEPTLNAAGRFRIDYEAARSVSVERVLEQPWVLKTLSLGTWADVELVEKILTSFPETIKKKWEKWDSEGRRTGKGYVRSPDQKQDPRQFLGELLDFRPGCSFVIPFSKLKTYEGAPGGCAVTEECDDHVPWTLDDCVAGDCYHTPDPTFLDPLDQLACGDGEVPAWSEGAGSWICKDTGPQVTEALVDAWVARAGYASRAELASLDDAVDQQNDSLDQQSAAVGQLMQDLASVGVSIQQLGAIYGALTDMVRQGQEDEASDRELIAAANLRIDELEQILADGNQDTLAGLTCADGQVARWDAQAGAWVCADVNVGVVTRLWDVQAKGTLIMQNSDATPVAPVAGQVFFDTVGKHFNGFNGTDWTCLDCPYPPQPNLSSPIGVTVGSPWKVCRADADTAWLSSTDNGGTYDALAACRYLGYGTSDRYGSNCGTVCGSCAQQGSEVYDGSGACNGDSLCGTVTWRCTR